MPRLFLLDGTALAYRSHFALARSGLTSTDGRPTGATYGFTMTLRRILEQPCAREIPLGINVESVSINRDEIDASVDLFHALHEVVRA